MRKIQNRIRDKIAKLRNCPLGKNMSLLNKQGLELFRLKLKNSELDHRVIFELDGDKVVILGVEHRDDGVETR